MTENKIVESKAGVNGTSQADLGSIPGKKGDYTKYFYRNIDKLWEAVEYIYQNMDRNDRRWKKMNEILNEVY